MANTVVGNLWAKESKEGRKYLSGYLIDIHGEIPIVIFANDKAQNDKAPTHRILLSEKREQQGGTNAPRATHDDFNAGRPQGGGEREVDISGITF